MIVAVAIATAMPTPVAARRHAAHTVGLHVASADADNEDYNADDADDDDDDDDGDLGYSVSRVGNLSPDLTE